MATKLASKYNYSYSNDADAGSDYGFDLTAEEEDLLETLVADASSKNSREASNQGTGPGGSQAYAAAFATNSDITALFATHHNGPSLLPSLATSGAEPSPDADDEITALVAEAEHRMSQPVQVGDIRYPDLSRALSNAFENPDNSALESDTSLDQRHQRLSPLIRFRSFPKKPFSVSDLVAGAWCELQYYYTLTKLPGGKKTRTSAMKGGSKVHQNLEDEIYTMVTIQIAKKEDAFGLKLWNLIQGLRALRDQGMTRELEVWGFVEGHLVNGVIDNLSYENPDPESMEEVRGSQGSQKPSKGNSSDQKITTFFHSSTTPQNKQVFITDVKTRASRHIPSGAALRPTMIQLFLYHRLLSEMAASQLDFLWVLRRYGLEPDEPFSDTFVAQIGSLHDEIFEDNVDDAVARPEPASSSHEPASSNLDLIRYRTLRQLIPLLETELRLTFPNGADSLGPLVTVEYRKRAKRNADGVEDPDDEEAGILLGTNLMRVDPRALDLYLQRDLEWWEGKRPPDGVMIEETYKCRSCEFAEDCEWRQKQDAAILQVVKRRVAGRRQKEAT